MKKTEDYCKLHLKTDVWLLVKKFVHYSKMCLEYYKLDTCRNSFSTGLSWDATLKITFIKLDLILDIDIYQFIEKRSERRNELYSIKM